VSSAGSSGSGLSIRGFLRHSTAKLHAGLDAKVAPLLGRGEHEYIAFLQKTARALFPIEAALEAASVATIVSDWPARSRKNALAADLDSLAVPVPTWELPVLTGDEAQLFGILYVLEGSHLGSRELSRIATAHPSARVRSATRYLRHGAGLHLWQSFLTRLELSAATRHTPNAALAGAEMVFALFDASFTDTPANPAIHV
jgi:heme oxygenase